MTSAPAASEPAPDGAVRGVAETPDVSNPRDRYRLESDRFVYTARIQDGQVFISLNTNPASRIGPFVKKSNGDYVCETDGPGRHSLRKDPGSNRWFYAWTYVEMRAQLVDGRVLDK